MLVRCHLTKVSLVDGKGCGQIKLTKISAFKRLQRLQVKNLREIVSSSIQLEKAAAAAVSASKLGRGD